MTWRNITNEQELNEAIESSSKKAVLMFKHSTRCSISSMVKARLEREWDDEVDCEPYYLDLIQHRAISNTIAQRFNIMHESPQAILIQNKEPVYHNSHMAISFLDISNLSKN